MINDLRESALSGIRDLLRLIGDNPDRDGLRDTPTRVINALIEATNPTGDDPKTLMGRVFDTTELTDQMIAVGPIPFTSLCEHHLLPFTGNAWIGYLPSGTQIVGLSKFARLVHHHATGLQVQERLTTQIVDSITRYAPVESAGCLIRSAHTCMTTRGIRSTGTIMVTSDLRGAFRESPSTRAEFLEFTRGTNIGSG